jgi:hypothetical protein
MVLHQQVVILNKGLAFEVETSHDHETPSNLLWRSEYRQGRHPSTRGIRADHYPSWNIRQGHQARIFVGVSVVYGFCASLWSEQRRF